MTALLQKKRTPQDISNRIEAITAALDAKPYNTGEQTLGQQLAHAFVVKQGWGPEMEPVAAAKVKSAVRAMAESPAYEIPKGNDGQLYSDVSDALTAQARGSRTV